MVERPMLFNGPMVGSILRGEKTQTRRLIKPQPEVSRLNGEEMVRFENNGYFGAHIAKVAADCAGVRCPYGVPGDRLWVKETHGIFGVDGRTVGVGYRERLPPGKTLAQTDGGLDLFLVTDEQAAWAEQRVDAALWRPSIHMPRWASRITLDVTDVRVERLQDISEGDARAEGAVPCAPDHSDYYGGSYRLGFEELWQSINGAESWSANPWVWAISFKRIEVPRA